MHSRVFAHPLITKKPCKYPSPLPAVRCCRCRFNRHCSASGCASAVRSTANGVCSGPSGNCNTCTRRQVTPIQHADAPSCRALWQLAGTCPAPHLAGVGAAAEALRLLQVDLVPLVVLRRPVIIHTYAKGGGEGAQRKGWLSRWHSSAHMCPCAICCRCPQPLPAATAPPTHPPSVGERSMDSWVAYASLPASWLSGTTIAPSRFSARCMEGAAGQARLWRRLRQNTLQQRIASHGPGPGPRPPP